MDKAPLNRAHQLERKAEQLNRQKKFDECVDCHQEAVELYKKCLALSNNKNALESIQLQKEFNERQIRMLQLKKSYLERTEKEKKLNGIVSSKHSQKDVVENLEAKIFRTIETHDSLICYLGQRGIIQIHDRQCPSTIDETEEKEGSPPIVGSKHPKDDSTVIEELKLLSGQLRESVQGLLIQLDDRNKEIEQLRAHIKELELEKSSKESDNKNLLKVAEDPSEATSPYIFSPITELSPEITDLSLPSLEPLQLPEFDISKLKQFNVPEVSSRLLRKEK